MTKKKNRTKQLGSQHAQLLRIEASANVRGELPAEHRSQQTPGGFRSLAEELLVLQGSGEPAQKQPFLRPLPLTRSPPPLLPPPPPPVFKWLLRSCLHPSLPSCLMDPVPGFIILTCGGSLTVLLRLHFFL